MTTFKAYISFNVKPQILLRGEAKAKKSLTGQRAVTE
jgi:hypothetical protein